MTERDVATFDITAYIRPGDRIVVEQGPAMPLTLSEMLVANAGELGRPTVISGAIFTDTFAPEAAPDFRYLGYGAIGKGATALTKAGLLDILPTSYGQMHEAFDVGRIEADVVLLHLSTPRNGVYSLGLVNDYSVNAARKARVVIAEVNDQMPFVHGAELPSDIRIDACVNTSRPPVGIPRATVGEVETRIGEHVASLISDGDTVQTGIGAIPDAILSALINHRHLGVHSGMIGDRVADLIESGVVTNEAKPIDTGFTVSNTVLGSSRIYEFVGANDTVRVKHTSYVHAIETLMRLPGFIAINSAVEVDLTGQVNAETAGGRYVGAIGGQPDFVRGALLTPGGKSIIALPATARDGTLSRIVSDLSGGIVTTPRSDGDYVVTEWGIASLRGKGLAERARQMINVAAPEHRDELARIAKQRFGS